MSAVVEGVDLDLLLEDQARLTRRVAELEDNQETIVEFLTKAFPKKAGQLRTILQNVEDKKTPVKPKSAYSSFGQEDEGLTTEAAVKRCFAAKSVTDDPVNSKAGISWPKKSPEISEGLGG